MWEWWKENLTNPFTANPAITKALFERFGVPRPWCTYIVCVCWGASNGLQDLFGDVLVSSLRSHFGITNLLRLRMDAMSIKMCISRAPPKQRVAHEYRHDSKTLGGVQINRRGYVSGAPSDANLALQTSSGWGPAPALPDPYPLKEGPE